MKLDRMLIAAIVVVFCVAAVVAAGTPITRSEAFALHRRRVESHAELFGEDVLRDVCRDVNDLMAGQAGHGIQANRIGIPEELWRSLLRAGGYRESGFGREGGREGLDAFYHHKLVSRRVA